MSPHKRKVSSIPHVPYTAGLWSGKLVCALCRIITARHPHHLAAEAVGAASSDTAGSGAANVDGPTGGRRAVWQLKALLQALLKLEVQGPAPEADGAATLAAGDRGVACRHVRESAGSTDTIHSSCCPRFGMQQSDLPSKQAFPAAPPSLALPGVPVLFLAQAMSLAVLATEELLRGAAREAARTSRRAARAAAADALAAEAAEDGSSANAPGSAERKAEEAAAEAEEEQKAICR